MHQTMTNKRMSGAYGAMAQRGVGAYQSSGGGVPPHMIQAVRMLDGLVEQIGRAHTCDVQKQYEAEYRAVELATLILSGLLSMIDSRQGTVGANLEKTYRSLMKALVGVCAMPGSQGQYLRLYEAALELRNAWASICNLPMMPMPEAFAAELASNPPVSGRGRRGAAVAE